MRPRWYNGWETSVPATLHSLYADPFWNSESRMINIHLPLQLNIAQYKITQVQLVYGKFFGEVFSKEMQFFRFYVNIKYSQKITVLCVENNRVAYHLIKMPGNLVLGSACRNYNL